VSKRFINSSYYKGSAEIEPERGGAALRKFFGSRNGAPRPLGRSKAERRAFCLLG